MKDQRKPNRAYFAFLWSQISFLPYDLMQVLRVYHDKCQKRLTRFQGAVAEGGGQGQASARQPVSATRKRRTSSNVSLADDNVDPVSKQLSHVGTARLSDGANCFREEHVESVASLEESDSLLKTSRDDVHMEQPRHSMENEGCPNKKMKPTRQRSLWTDEADR